MEASTTSSLNIPTATATRNLFAPVAALLLLAAALLFIYSNSGPAVTGLSYVADIDFWQRTPRQRIVSATTHFDLNHDLNQVPMQLGDWQGEERPETNQEVMITLEPEQYVQRLYHNQAGQSVWLSMIGGRTSRPFHPPDICYNADGWTFNFGSHPTKLTDGGDIYGYYLEAQKPQPNGQPPLEHIVYYFFLFPNHERKHSDGIVLFKLTSGRYGTLDETLAIQEDFIRNFFTSAQ